MTNYVIFYDATMTPSLELAIKVTTINKPFVYALHKRNERWPVLLDKAFIASYTNPPKNFSRTVIEFRLYSLHRTHKQRDFFASKSNCGVGYCSNKVEMWLSEYTTSRPLFYLHCLCFPNLRVSGSYFLVHISFVHDCTFAVIMIQ